MSVHKYLKKEWKNGNWKYYYTNNKYNKDAKQKIVTLENKKSGKYVDLSSGKSSYLGKYVGFTVNGKGKGNPNTKMIDKNFGPLSIYGEYSKGSKMFNLNIGIHTAKVKNAAKKGKAYILKKLK